MSKFLFNVHRSRLAAVHGHADLPLQVGLQEVLEGVVVLVEPRLADGHDEVEEGLQAGSRTRGILLDPQDVVTLRAATRDFDALTSAHASAGNYFFVLIKVKSKAGDLSFKFYRLPKNLTKSAKN